MRKRIFSLLLALLLCVGTATPVFAAFGQFGTDSAAVCLDDRHVAYDREADTIDRTDVLIWIPISLAAGALLSFLVPMAIFKRQLKSVRRQTGASDYVRPNSMRLTQQRDLFLYRSVTRTPKPKANNISTSDNSGRR